MKMKKALAVVATAAMVVGMMPISASAANSLKSYDFNDGTTGDMTPTGYGTAPTVVDDAERGSKVLQFHDGAAGKVLAGEENGVGKYGQKFEKGTASSLQFENPFKGHADDASGITITYWVKTTLAASDANAGILGFISGEKTYTHPDKAAGISGKEDLEDAVGPQIFGVTIGNSMLQDQPCVSYAGMLKNSYYFNDEKAVFGDENPTWHFVVLSLKNGAKVDGNKTQMYVDGKEVAGRVDSGDRYNDGETGTDTSSDPQFEGHNVNKGQPSLMTFFNDTEGKGVTGYVGESFWGSTVEGVCIDDLTFYEGAMSSAEATAAYEAAKSGSASANGGGSASGNDSNAGNQAGDNGSSSDGNNSSTGSNGGSNNSSTGNNSTSTSSTNKTNSSNATASNLPQTGVMDTSLLIACGVAAVVAGALLFRKKESKNEQ